MHQTLCWFFYSISLPHQEVTASCGCNQRELAQYWPSTAGKVHRSTVLFDSSVTVEANMSGQASPAPGELSKDSPPWPHLENILCFIYINLCFQRTAAKTLNLQTI